MAVSFTETIAGRFLDLGGAVFNVRHPSIGARGDGAADDGAVLRALEASHYVVPAGRYRIAGESEIPAGAALTVLRGAEFVLDPGASLRVRGAFDAGAYPVFSGAGQVTFDPGAADGILPQWWGARADGRSDDTAAIRAALAASASVYLPQGEYRITSTIDIGHAKRVRGAGGAMYSAARTAVRARASELGEGRAIFRLNPTDDTTVADVVVEGIHFLGDNDSFHFRRLSAAEDRGVIGIDATHVKDHVVIRDCSFRALKRGIGERERVDYTGQVYVSDCHFLYCYRAVELVTSTPLAIHQCDFRECADWIDAANVSVHDCAFNNTSFSTEYCGVDVGGVGVIAGCWFEGGNHQVRMLGGGRNEVTLIGNHFSACHSAHGATKYTVFLAPGRFTAIGNFSAENNRFFDFREADDYRRYHVRMVNNHIETPYWKFASYDPDALGFDYVGDDADAGRAGEATVVLDDVAPGRAAAPVVRIGRVDGAFRYAVEVFGAADSGREPRVVTRHAVLAQPGAGSIVASPLHEDVAAARVTFEVDAARGEILMRLENRGAAPIRRPVVRITAIGPAPVIGAVAPGAAGA
ncbi:MAG TPA: glycosyl hydrolase family 28-related protein [Longimicrobiales bacterium]